MKEKYYELNSEKYIQESNSKNTINHMHNFYLYMENELKNYNNPNILDIGFGSARDMLYFSKNYNIEGIDTCKAFVKNAKSLNLNVFHSNIEDFSKLTSKKYDLIYSVGVIMHLNKLERVSFFNSVKQLLSDNGTFVVSYNELDRTEDEYRKFCLTKEEEINKEINMKLVKTKLFTDKRGFDWITASYKK